MRNLTRIATCVLAATALSGCQSFLSALNFGGDKVQRADAQSGPVFGAEELENGRMALKAGYAANAIQQFRMAALNEETAPDAFNGMAVAYARLGRADLAERYFKMALSLDSANPKYAANLDRFYNSPLGNSVRALAMREKEAAATLAAAEKAAEQDGLLDTPTSSERRGAVVLETPRVQMSRTSNREITLATRGSDEPGSGSMPVVAIRNPAKAKMVEADVQAEEQDEAQSGDKVEKSSGKRISMIGASGDASSYPVRISLVKPNSTAIKSTPRKSGYPLRVALGPVSSGE